MPEIASHKIPTQLTTLPLDADCDSVALGFVVDSTMIRFKPQ